MEHPCHRCNSPVEDGVPFCPKCGAPQIRVATPENDEPVTPSFPPGTPGEVQPPAQPVYGTQASWGSIPVLDPNRVSWRAALPGAALVGLLGGAISFVLGRYLPLLLLMLFVIGAAAVKIYRSRTRVPVRPGTGAKIGIFAGLFSFLLYAVAVIGMFSTGTAVIQQNMREAMKMQSANVDPQTLEIMQRMVDRMSTPEGMAAICVVILAVLFVTTVIFTGIGGAVGAAVFGKDTPTT